MLVKQSLTTLAALTALTVGSSASATVWTNLYSNDFEADTVGAAPTLGSGGYVVVNQDASVTVVNATLDGAGAMPQAPITGNAVRLHDPNTNGGTPSNSAGRFGHDLGTNHSVLRLDFDWRRYNAGSAQTPFRVVLYQSGLNNPGSGSNRPVELRLKMSGASVEAFHQNAPGVAGPTGNDVLGFFDGGASGNTFQDETVSVSIIANGHGTDTLVYDALNGSGSVSLLPKTYHVYTEGSGAPSVGILPAVGASPHTLYGNTPGSEFYLYDRDSAGGTYYGGPDEIFGNFAFFAAGDEGPFDFMFDNVNVFTTPIPEPASIALLGLGGLAMLRHRQG